MKYKFILVLFSVILIVGCSKKGDSINYEYIYSKPIAYSDGIEVSSLESEGMKESSIRGMMDYINSVDQHRIHNILILKNSKLVFEEYFEGYALNMNVPSFDGALMQYDKNTDHFMASVSKSVTSVIFGIAVKDGYITDLDNKVIDYFPQFTDVLTGDKANITIRHLLTMTCGLAFDESSYLYGDPRNELTQVIAMDDPLNFIFSKPLLTSPGTQFHYSSACGIVLSAILEEATGMSFLDYANENLFDPLQSEGGSWSAMHSGLFLASGGLYFKARELSKIGLLFLNEGQWEGTQIITEDWIQSSQEEHISTGGGIFPNTSYGYQWWNTHVNVNGTSHSCFFAAGWGDQYMFIIPGLELIVEFNAGNYVRSATISPFYLLENYILEAIK